MRRLILRAFIALALVLPLYAFSFGVQVSANGTNDQAAIQSAVDGCRTSGVCKVELDNATYYVDHIDATRLSGLTLIGHGDTRIIAAHMTVPGPVVDLTDSANWVVRDITGFNLGPNSHGVTPTHFINARREDKVRIEFVRTPGAWTVAAIGIYGVHSVTITSGQINNFDASAPALEIANDTPGRNSSDVLLVNTEEHQGGASGGCTVKVTQSDHIVKLGGISDNSVDAHWCFAGNVRNVTWSSVKFYSELGHPAQTVVRVGTGPTDGLSFARLVNPFRDGISYLTQGPVDMSTFRIETP